MSDENRFRWKKKERDGDEYLLLKGYSIKHSFLHFYLGINYFY